MKRKLMVLVSLLAMAWLVSGCFALYGDIKDYKEDDWYGLAGSREVAKIQQDKIALDKLKNSTIKGSIEDGGYLGKVANLNEWEPYNFEVNGPETRSWFVDPANSLEYNLPPGTYRYKISDEYGRIRDKGTFHVTAQKHNFRGEEYHWYLWWKR